MFNGNIIGAVKLSAYSITFYLSIGVSIDSAVQGAQQQLSIQACPGGLMQEMSRLYRSVNHAE